MAAPAADASGLAAPDSARSGSEGRPAGAAVHAAAEPVEAVPSQTQRLTDELLAKETSDEPLRVSATRVLAQLPAEALAVPVDRLAAELGAQSFLLVPRRLALAQLSGGIVRAEWDLLAPQIPSHLLADEPRCHQGRSPRRAMRPPPRRDRPTVLARDVFDGRPRAGCPGHRGLLRAVSAAERHAERNRDRGRVGNRGIAVTGRARSRRSRSFRTRSRVSCPRPRTGRLGARPVDGDAFWSARSGRARPRHSHRNRRSMSRYRRSGWKKSAQTPRPSARQSPAVEASLSPAEPGNLMRSRPGQPPRVKTTCISCVGSPRSCLPWAPWPSRSGWWMESRCSPRHRQHSTSRRPHRHLAPSAAHAGRRAAWPVDQVTLRDARAALVLTPLGPLPAGGPVLAVCVPPGGGLALLELRCREAAAAQSAASAPRWTTGPHR